MQLELSERKKTEISSLRRAIVWQGKRSAKFKEVAKVKGRDNPKYADPDNMIDTGAVPEEDCFLLYSLIQEWRPNTIVEIGTWFGTSAMIMAKAMIDAGIQGRIYTCDKHDVYCPGEPYSDLIKYKNMQSGEFLKRLLKKRVAADMFFVDASLKGNDHKLIRKLRNGKLRFVGHDYHQKGKRNCGLMKQAVKSLKFELHGITFVLREK